MNKCLDCGKQTQNDDEHCEECAFIKLEKYIAKLYEEQERRKRG